MKSGPQLVPFPPPTAGLVTVTARAAQPTRASVNMSNVTCFGADGRMRVQPRAGTVTLMGQTNVIGVTTTNRQTLCLHETEFLNGAGDLSAYIIAVASQDIYQIVPPSGTTPAVVSLRGSAKFVHSRRVRAATMGAYTFLVSGYDTPQKLKLDDGTVSDYTASTAGTLPSGFRLILAARGRIWMAGDPANPNNWVASRQGDAFDWDTAEDDVGAAIEGNTGFRGGQIGQPINAFFAGKDDTIIFGCRSAIYELQGEPTYGTLLVRSTGVGILTAESWCMGPSGEIYFVGTGGFYKLPIGGAPQPISIDKVQDYFTDLGEVGYWINCVWDANRFGVHIFIAPPVNADGSVTGSARSLFWNARTDGFEPRTYPEDHGPICAIRSDTGLGSERRVIMGGRKGILMALSDDVASDANSSGTSVATTAISSHAIFGPVRPAGPGDEAKMIELQVTLGEPQPSFASSDFRCGVDIYAGVGPFDAISAPEATASATLDAVQGRQASIHKRLKGNAFYVKFSNSTAGKLWSVDEVNGRFLPGGRVAP